MERAFIGLKIKKGEGSQSVGYIENYSRGRNLNEAEKLASTIGFEILEKCVLLTTTKE